MVRTGANENRGTWVHEDIALDVARWLSPDFHAYLLKTMRRFIRGEITTEESKAAKKAFDALREESRIRFEQAQKQLQAVQVDLEFSEGRRLQAEANSKKFWRQVDQATAEVDDLKKQLGMKRQNAGKRKRMQEGKHFLQEVSRVLQEYRDGVPGPWPEVETPLGLSVLDFVGYLDTRSTHQWAGRSLDTFGELPATKNNPRQWNLMQVDRELGVNHENIIAVPNPDTKANLWQTC